MIENLLQVVAAPPERVPSQVSVDWPGVEARLGSALPIDYKDLVSRFGAGSFGGFIHIYQPQSPNEHIDLESQAAASRWALDYLRQGGESIPYDIDGPASLLSVGRTDNGDIIYWIRNATGDPDSWNVVVNESRGDVWVEFNGSITDFLAAVLSASFRPDVFPDDFPPPDPQFEPY